ncbi:MAG: DUF5411 family protein [Firmicutes bacterium]|nr:DUF5411 family protein [Bacillota bacterium]
MKETMWAWFVVVVGIVCLGAVFFFQRIVNTSEHNYYMLKEVAEASMWDAIDLGHYRTSDGEIKIIREKFVESFIRRFAESANLSRNYLIQIYDVNEIPPKVSIKVSSKETGVVNSEEYNFDIINKLDAIFETPY